MYRSRVLLISRKVLYRRRLFSSLSNNKGLILGLYEKNEESVTSLSANAEKFNSLTNGSLLQHLSLFGKELKKGKSRIFYSLDNEYPVVSVIGLGPKNAGYNELEEIEEKRENIRAAIGIATLQLRDIGVSRIAVDDCGDVEASAEGAFLSTFSYDELKQESSRKPKVTLELYNSNSGTNSWMNGSIKAEGQNIARNLMETPSNHMTPTIFAETAKNLLEPLQVTVIARNKEWAKEKKMGAFLSVSQGSNEPPVFLEMIYKGRNDDSKPLVLVGKGVTFDSGGISIKPAQGMDSMRGDMGGAAVTIGTIYSLAKLKVPINVVGLIPLCENMPGGKATKPGDVVTAMNGKTIQVDNTDAEGRLILADALCYSDSFDPYVVVDIATLTGAVDVALGSGAAGVFTNSAKMWMILQRAGMGTGDRVWRLPLFNHYSKQILKSQLADVNNIGKHARQGGACTAAAFLKEFVKAENWVHIDIAGVMENKDEVPYLGKGMTGRPTRTLVEFAQNLAQHNW